MTAMIIRRKFIALSPTQSWIQLEIRCQSAVDQATETNEMPYRVHFYYNIFLFSNCSIVFNSD